MPATGQVVRVAAHCTACGQQIELTGPDTPLMLAALLGCHYLPVIDELDVHSPQGVETWRRTS